MFPPEAFRIFPFPPGSVTSRGHTAIIFSLFSLLRRTSQFWNACPSLWDYFITFFSSFHPTVSFLNSDDLDMGSSGLILQFLLLASLFSITLPSVSSLNFPFQSIEVLKNFSYHICNFNSYFFFVPCMCFLTAPRSCFEVAMFHFPEVINAGVCSCDLWDRRQAI